MSAQVDLKVVTEFSLGQDIGMLRAVPVRLKGGKKAVLVVYCADFDVDPSYEMFFFPTDTLKLALYSLEGEQIWKKDLGKGVVPGIWFCPVFPFDLNGDGEDEIWFVNNTIVQHPLTLKGYVLERLEGSTGETLGQFPWTYYGERQALSPQFRNFILGGYANGEPVLVTAQGTYHNMHLQGWNADMTMRWRHDIANDDPGARGSHMTPVVDINNDGVDEVLWGERGIEVDTGRELFCGDRDVYRGHSDIIQPIRDRDSNQLYIYTVRESDPTATPRVVLFNGEGQRVWGNVDHGHIDMGWAARIKDDQGHVVMAIRIGSKTCGPDGRFHQNMDEFTYDALSGEEYPLPFSIYRTFPVDLNGDGYHELVRGVPNGDGEVFDRHGQSIGNVGGTVAMASKFMDLPGEQLLCFYPDGTIRIWADANAKDSETLLERCAHPFYKGAQRITAVGYNVVLMAGL
ncbi:rhamnogalacturonan lyase family protein [Paenibacillus cremeus]|uniref:Rhamnogalacturonan lyase family 11 C-terminal domain-containing protein n=1 Tax=Paenibacillus cremeus TaxID=2163881 RepID=A0A559K9Q1_9BACL|nr:hypothetical protein [Paenibacillus cremeus]TVY08858.1 hypothetical protein FPZ49_16415 [Paenibacillus cremeus]